MALIKLVDLIDMYSTYILQDKLTEFTQIIQPDLISISLKGNLYNND